MQKFMKKNVAMISHSNKTFKECIEYFLFVLSSHFKLITQGVDRRKKTTGI